MVDDDRDMEQMLTEFINTRSDEAVGCNSGGQALRLLQEHDFQIVLTEWQHMFQPMSSSRRGGKVMLVSLRTRQTRCFPHLMAMK